VFGGGDVGGGDEQPLAPGLSRRVTTLELGLRYEEGRVDDVRSARWSGGGVAITAAGLVSGG
jgi:hypothetical protein